MGLLDDLLQRGYLPIQLPPGFSSSTFSPGVELLWPEAAPPRTVAEKYSVARSSYYRRSTALVNPIAFYYLARDIAAHWTEIEAHYHKSPLSHSIPRSEVAGSLRGIELPKFSDLHEQKITASSGYRFALVTDITSYFPTIYTHSIPWALHTKTVAKVNQEKRKRIPTLLGNLLDRRSMSLQDGQTIGLPIGPDTSHILAEIIGIAIDEGIKQELGTWPDGFRYVDDFFLFFSHREDAEKALASVTKAVSEFELHVNAAKTRIVEVKELMDESWKYRVKRLSIAAPRKQQRDDIHHFFESLFSLERKFKDESLVKYGVKRLSSVIIKKSNWPVFEAYLLKCGYTFPNTLQIIAHILATYEHFQYPLNREAITRFCDTLLLTSTSSNHHGEVSWLLWICKELRLTLDPRITKEVFRMPGSVCKILALDLYNRGNLTGEAPNESVLRSTASEKALTGVDWLLAYEGGRRKWLHNSDLNFIEKHLYFGPMLALDVQFYDDRAELQPIFQFTDPARPVDSFDFDTDSVVDQNFEFQDLDDEYSDSTASAKEVDLDDMNAGEEDDDFEDEF